MKILAFVRQDSRVRDQSWLLASATHIGGAFFCGTRQKLLSSKFQQKPYPPGHMADSHRMCHHLIARLNEVGKLTRVLVSDENSNTI